MRGCRAPATIVAGVGDVEPEQHHRVGKAVEAQDRVGGPSQSVSSSIVAVTLSQSSLNGSLRPPRTNPMGRRAIVARHDAPGVHSRNHGLVFRPGALGRRFLGGADIDEAGHPLVLAAAERGGHVVVIGRPFGQPLRRIADGVRGVQHVHADRAAGQRLLPLGDLVLRRDAGGDGGR